MRAPLMLLIGEKNRRAFRRAPQCRDSSLALLVGAQGENFSSRDRLPPSLREGWGGPSLQTWGHDVFEPGAQATGGRSCAGHRYSELGARNPKMKNVDSNPSFSLPAEKFRVRIMFGDFASRKTNTLRNEPKVNLGNFDTTLL